jgi:hypothetical protein
LLPGSLVGRGLTVAHYVDYDACFAFHRTWQSHSEYSRRLGNLGYHTDAAVQGAIAETALTLWADLLNHHLALLNPGAVLRAVDAVLLREAVDRWTPSEPLTTPALARALCSALYAPDEPPALVYAPPRPRTARKPL